MHMIGMNVVSYKTMNNTLHYNMYFSLSITVASLLAGIVSVTLPFIYIDYCNLISPYTSYTKKLLHIINAGIFIGGGVCTMHYVQMMAMNCNNVHVTFNILLLIGSVIIGLFASCAGMTIYFLLQSMWINSLIAKLLCACIVGLAVNAMHYTGMAATYITPINININHITVLQCNINDHVNSITFLFC